jgi:BNR/Asp-box repeat
MKKSIIIFLLFYYSKSDAQRWHAVNDSTSYNYQNITITVGRNKVYLNENNALTLINDFSINNSQIPEDYIRDFDFIDQDTWYVLVGSRYFGWDTILYKTDDGGISWELIVPQSFTVPSTLDGIAGSINQVQVLNGRIYLFDSYYQSSVFYSDDLGETWKLWFIRNYWSHYYQIFPCGNTLYIQSLQGDGFWHYLVKIPESYFGQQNINVDDFDGGVGGCQHGSLGCYYPPWEISTVPGVYYYFKDLIENTICPALHTDNPVLGKTFAFYNSIEDTIFIEGINNNKPFQTYMYNSLGQCSLKNYNQKKIDCTIISAGLYFIKIIQDNATKTVKVIVN